MCSSGCGAWGRSASTRARAPGGSVGAEHELYEDDDGLSASWCAFAEAGLVYVNSEYGRALPRWMARCAFEACGGIDIIALFPARTDTRWSPWHAQALCFWRGRLTFEGAPAPAPFPSALAIWSQSQATVGAFVDAFADAGKVVRL